MDTTSLACLRDRGGPLIEPAKYNSSSSYPVHRRYKRLPDAFQDSTCEARINRKRWPIASWIWAGEVVVSGEVRVSGWQRSTALCLSKYRKKCASFDSHPALSSPPGISYTSPKRYVRTLYVKRFASLARLSFILHIRFLRILYRRPP